MPVDERLVAKVPRTSTTRSPLSRRSASPTTGPDLDLHGKSVLVFDDGLHSVHGHFYGYDIAVIEVLQQHGAKVTVLCHERFDQIAAMEATGARVLPLIRRSVWTGHAPPRSGLRELATWLRQAGHFAAVLDRHLADEQYDLVFAPNAMVYDSLAWLMLWGKNRFRNVGRLVLLFRFAVQHHPDYTGSNLDPSAPLSKRTRLWKWIAERLSGAVANGRIAYLTDSLRLAKEYHAALDLDLAVAPSPRALPERVVATLGDSARPLTFALLGYARWARGTDLFEKAIAALLEHDNAAGLSFSIQWYSDVIDPQGDRYEPRSSVLASDSVEIIDQPLSMQEYEALFARIDCMVLPYRREYYYSQISGVAIEAASAGIPMIFTADTWLEDFVVEQGTGIAVQDGDVAALVGAIQTMAANYPGFLAKAIERSVLARELNSPEAFLRVLWGATGQVGTTA